MRVSASILGVLLLAAGSAPAQNLVKTKAKTTSSLPGTTKLKLVEKKYSAPKKVDSVPVIVFKRTPCFGTCPHYEATIYADGRVAYIGFRDVPLTGAHTLQLPAATVEKIMQEAKRLNFATYDERYGQGTTDLPATVLSIRQDGGKLKTVQAEEGTPPELQQLLLYIGEEVEKLAGPPVR